MSDPYKVLGISRDATDEQVKEAYREMAKKYHPDNYQGSPIADLANEKMKEVNEAYDQIMNERKNRKNGGSSSQGYSGGYNPNYSNPNSNFADGCRTNFKWCTYRQQKCRVVLFKRNSSL